MPRTRSAPPADTTGVEGPSIQPHQQRISSEKRRVILNASIESFLADGYQATRMDSIGNRAGVSYATLYKHFPSKEELFLATVDHVSGRIFERWKALLVPEELESGLQAIARNYHTVVSDPDLVAMLRVVIGQVHTLPAAGKRFLQDRAMFSDLTDKWLRTRAQEGGLKIANVSQARAELIGMLSEAFLMPRLLMPDYSCSARVASQRIASIVDTFLSRYRSAR